MIRSLISAALLVIATAAAFAQEFDILRDFKVEELHRTNLKTEGSWVSICIDGKGNLLASDQYGYIWRITPPPIGQKDGVKIEQVKLAGGRAHGLLWAFDSLYFMGGLVEGKDLPARTRDDRSLWRARDADGDGTFEEVKRIVSFEGSGEHSPHALALSPDGKQIYFTNGNHTKTPEFGKSLVPKRWQEDHLLPRMWDARGHARGVMAPGGYIARCDPDGENFEVFSIGFRNAYDIAFDANGEMFTYDSDMEWDLGSPWYRPTRVVHAVSGSEFGWRSGSGKWPEHYVDSLPAINDVGPGSPTGVAFGTGAKFPAKYQRALFAMDWSFGTLYAIHLTPEGASYKATREVFLAGNALPLADLVVRPQDGALYLVTGGRKTQGGLYRITYSGSESTAKAAVQPLTELQQLRRRIETHHRPGDKAALTVAWPYLDHEDRFIRFAARTAIEQQPALEWSDKALTESRPRALREALTALARCTDDKTVQPRLIQHLLTQDFAKLDERSRLSWLRTCSLGIIRLGDPAPETASALLASLDKQFPTGSALVDRELANLLIRLKSPTIVAKGIEQMYTAKDAPEAAVEESHLKRGGRYGNTIAEMQQAPTHKQQIHFAFNLRAAAAGWTPELRDKYFAWFGPARKWKGGNSFAGFLTNARDEALAKVGDTTEKQRLLLLAMGTSADPKELPRAKGPGSNYTAADFQDLKIEQLQKRDLAHGRQMYEAALCAACHKFGTEGGVGGPDLTGAAGRYTPADLLAHIIDPDKEVSDQYAFTEFTLKNGNTVLGRVAREDGKALQLITSFLAPEALTPLPKGSIKTQQISKVSPMMPGLLNSLNRDEVLDLLGFLLSGTK